MPPDFIEQIRSFSDHPWQPAAMGVGTGDVPAFHGMHEASALVAGGSIGAVQRILSGDADHAFSPAGGLHHAMPTRASGFCVYNDVALAVATARDAGHRVLYIDLDVHHGDGTQAMFWDDPEVLTFSIHESGSSLFPGTGSTDETGGAAAAGTAVNVPLGASSGDASWWPAIERMLPAVCTAFKPTFIVSQHGCDSHASRPTRASAASPPPRMTELPGWSTSSAMSTARVAGWRLGEVATTPIVWCRVHGH